MDDYEKLTRYAQTSDIREGMTPEVKPNKNKPSHKIIGFRCRWEDYEKLKSAAKMLNCSQASFIKIAVFRELNAILNPQNSKRK